jgi:glutamine synthetase
MTEEQRREQAIAALPGSLERALDVLTADEAVCGWLGPELLNAYVRLKKSEIAAVKGQSDEVICSRYAAAY